jgi:hypothetical protein
MVLSLTDSIVNYFLILLVMMNYRLVIEWDYLILRHSADHREF